MNSEIKAGSIILILTALVMLLIIMSVGCTACNWGSKAVAVVAKEVDPAYLLKKYEWFKDQAAALDSMNAKIETLRNRLNDFDKRYKDVDILSIPESVLARRDQAATELAGVIAKYNNMASEYNAQMAKINWAFTNVGQLPKGATEPLPREFREYKSE